MHIKCYSNGLSAYFKEGSDNRYDRPTFVNESSIRSKVCHTLYRVMHNVRNTQVKGRLRMG